MNESEFENELRQFQPACASNAPREEVARSLEHPSPIADRVLASFLTCGGAAALLLISLHAVDFINRPASPPSAPQATQQFARDSLAQRQELLGELARGNSLAFNH